MKYTDVRYAGGRISHTYIFHDGKLYYVEDCFGEEAILVSTTGGREGAKIKDLDLTPPQLGYVNLPRASCTVVRGALRRDWRQGLRNTNIAVYHFNDYEKDDEININSRSFFKFLELTAKDVYPTFIEAVGAVEEFQKSCSFSKHYSVNEDGELIRKSVMKIGQVQQDNLLSLFPRFLHLKESLEEILNPQNVRLKLEA